MESDLFSFLLVNLTENVKFVYKLAMTSTYMKNKTSTMNE